MIGIGYLTLPSSCKAVGLCLGLLLIIFSGLASLYSEHLLLRVYWTTYVSNYPDLVKEILGPKHFIFMNINLMLYLVFSSTMYIYFGNEIFLSVVYKYVDNLGDNQISLIKILIFSMAFVLSFFKMEKIRWFGYIGNAFSFYTAVVLIG